MPIASDRLGLVLALVLLAGCADDRAARPLRVTAAPTTTVTTTSVAPPVTKPLTTAPPSPLLDEVVAAYDAAWADILSAESTLDDQSVALGDHLADPQLSTWRRVIATEKAAGHRILDNPKRPQWRRVEGLRLEGPDEVVIVVCRIHRQETISADGAPIAWDSHPYRYAETLTSVDGRWKWIGRESLDESSNSSDCALP